MDDALRAPATLRVRVDEIVPLAPGRAALLRDVVTSAYEAHDRELFAYALRATGDHEVAADLVQDCYLRLVRELHRGRQPELVRPWLYRVLTNLIVSRRRHLAVLGRWRRELERREKSTDSTDSPLTVRETTEEVERALLQLSRDSRTAILLASRGFDGPQIAAQLGRSHAATRTLLCRARMRLRTLLEQDDR